MSFLFSQPAPGILPANSVDFSEVETIGASTLLGNKLGTESTIQELNVSDVSTLLNLGSLQPLDSDLTAIAGLSPSDDDLIQRKAGVWTNRTPAQLKIDLSLTKSDVGLSNVDNTSDANKPVSTATQSALNAKQDTLVSGTNIKTVSGNSLVGSGDVGTIGLAYGGTGQTTANAALNALLPSQGSNTNKFLKTDGSNTSWATAGVSTVAGDVYKVLASDGTTTTWQYAGLGDGNLGTNNIFLGRGYNNTGFTPGTDNVIIGLGTGPGNSNGGCVIIGNRAGASNGIINAVAIGIEAAGNNPTVSNVVAIGYQAFYKYADHSDSVGVGYQAGYNFNGVLAARNSYLGYRAGFTGGLYNSAIGYGACGSSQNYCQAVGYEALNASTGDANTAIGFSALKSVNGNYNIGVGNRAGLSASGNYGLFIGNYAGSQSSASNEFYLSNLTSQLANNALEKTNSLLYGTFNSTPSSQTLTCNAEVTATYGLSVSTAGRGLSIKSGPNAKIGTATFTAQSTVTVNTTAVTANSLIFVTGQDGNDAFCVGNKNPGAGTFDIVHSTGNVTATVAWMIVEATP
jgi:hypothetical protein